MQVITGLEQFVNCHSLQKKIKGNVAYLCHGASVDKNLILGVFHLQKILGKRLVKIMGPQHGFVTDVQDNMVETKDFIHPFFKIPVLSLYSETRVPTNEMLDGVDTVVVDLQDVGTRVYTYISTMSLLMEKCGKLDINVVIFDRPNPVGGEIVEGNLLEEEFTSFVGRHPIPMRHGMTMGEMALYAKKFQEADCNLTVIQMKNWHRATFFDQTDLTWVPPSPNLPTIDSAFTFVGTVLFEGTNISEGRGTTRSLEIVGHSGIEPFSFHKKISEELCDLKLEGFTLRPIMFMPTFQKLKDTPCGGFHIHVTDKNSFRPWRLGQFLCRKFIEELPQDFKWKEPPYEYEFKKLPIDLINGTDKIRKWVESSDTFEKLLEIETKNLFNYMEKRDNCLLYHGENR